MGGLCLPGIAPAPARPCEDRLLPGTADSKGQQVPVPARSQGSPVEQRIQKAPRPGGEPQGRGWGHEGCDLDCSYLLVRVGDNEVVGDGVDGEGRHRAAVHGHHAVMLEGRRTAC